MHDMLDPDDRDAVGVDGADRRDQHRGIRFGQAAGDLVEQQQARMGRERARQFEPLAIEQRQAAGERVGLAAAGR